MKRNRLQEAEMAVLATLKNGCANAATNYEKILEGGHYAGIQ